MELKEIPLNLKTGEDKSVYLLNGVSLRENDKVFYHFDMNLKSKWQ